MNKINDSLEIKKHQGGDDSPESMHPEREAEEAS
jgi:hypothetical protein